MKGITKRQISFKDADNIKYKLDLEITHRNGYPEFSISGEGNGSCGQCQDSIKPSNKKQSELLKLANEYHLNGMSAGTEKQNNLLKNMSDNYEYDKACSYLNSHTPDGKPITSYDLDVIEAERKNIKNQIKTIKEEIKVFEEEKQTQKRHSGGGFIQIKQFTLIQHYNNITGFVNFFKKEIEKRNEEEEKLKAKLDTANEKTLLFDRREDGTLYEYGIAWIKKDLPETFWENINKLCDKIEEIEDTNKVTGGSWDDIDNERIVALGKYLDLSPSEANEDITEEYDNEYSYCGTGYYVVTDDEAHDKAIDYLDDSELWKDAVSSGNTELGLDEWKEYVVKTDGYSSILNHWDGTQDTEGDYIIMRSG